MRPFLHLMTLLQISIIFVHVNFGRNVPVLSMSIVIVNCQQNALPLP